MSEQSAWSGLANRSRSLAREVFDDATSGVHNGTFAIPLAFSTVIVGTGYLFPENFVFGISLHLIDIVSGVASLVIFALWRLIQKLFANKRSQGYVLWLLAGLAANIIPHLFIYAISMQISAEFTSSGIVGLVTYPLIMTLLGILISSWLNHRDQLKKLLQQRAQLLEMRNTLDDEVAGIKQELKKAVEKNLGEVLEKAELSLRAKGSAGVERVGAGLRETIDLVIRPISQKLAFESDAVEGAANSFADKDRFLQKYLEQKVPKVKVPKISLGNVFSPIIYVSLAAVFAIPAMFYVEGELGAIKSALALALTAIALVLTKIFARSITMQPLALLGLGSLISFAVSIAAGFLVWQFDPQSVGPIAVALCITLCSVGGQIIIYISIRRMKNLAERQETNDAIELLVTRLRQEVWLARRNLARIVHGRVQSKLLAASLRLSQNESPTEADIALAHTDVTEAINSIAMDLDNENEDFVIQFERIQEAWDGVCEVNLECASSLIEKIDADSNSRTCVIEIVTESVANAAKHSTAARVDVNLGLKRDGYLSIVITSAGNEIGSNNPVSGYGSHLMDEMTTKWSRTINNGVFQLKALIALNPTFGISESRTFGRG
jgi:signal transduction histidine kinase